MGTGCSLGSVKFHVKIFLCIIGLFFCFQVEILRHNDKVSVGRIEDRVRSMRKGHIGKLVQ